MKTLHFLLVAATLVSAVPASALDRVLPAPRIKDNGDVRLADDLKIGRYQGGKFIPLGPADEMSVTPLPGMIARALSTSLADLPVRPEQYKLASDPDDTLSFQRAAATGRLLQLKDGSTYTVCAAIGVSRGVLGVGATIKPCTNFTYPRTTAIIVTTGETRSVPQQPLDSIFYNVNWSAPALTDNNLVFRGFTIDARGTSVVGDGEFIPISVRMATNVLVDGVTCYGGGDCTAFQATDGTAIINSSAYLFQNAGFDHWEGPRNALVQNNTVVCAPRRNGGTAGADGGIMFSAAGTFLADKQGANLTSRGNRISGGCNSGLFVNVLSPGSSLTNVTSEGDQIDATGNASMAGVIFDGNVKGGRITALTALNGNGPNAVLLRQDEAGSGKPSDVLVDGARVSNWTTASANYSPFTLFGTGHMLTNTILKGGTNSTSVATDSATTVVSGTFNPATTFGPVQAVGGTWTNPGCRVAGTVASPGTATACN